MMMFITMADPPTRLAPSATRTLLPDVASKD